MQNTRKCSAKAGSGTDLKLRVAPKKGTPSRLGQCLTLDWASVCPSIGSVPDPVVFLDRDGVINSYPGDKFYVTSLRKFKFLPRAKKAVALLSKRGFKVFVASNQAGIGKGSYSQKTLDSITVKMLSDIEKSGGLITKVYYCRHRKDAGCACRKPKPGLLKQAAREFKFNLKGAYFIGDTIRDVLTAQAAGCQSVLVLSGKEKLANQKNWEAKPDFVFKDLFAAAKFLT